MLFIVLAQVIKLFDNEELHNQLSTCSFVFATLQPRREQFMTNLVKKD